MSFLTPSKDAAIVLDGASGHVIFSRNADEPRFPASLTKMMLPAQSVGSGRPAVV